MSAILLKTTTTTTTTTTTKKQQQNESFLNFTTKKPINTAKHTPIKFKVKYHYFLFYYTTLSFSSLNTTADSNNNLRKRIVLQILHFTV